MKQLRLLFFILALLCAPLQGALSQAAVDPNNSTSATLGAAGVFLGGWQSTFGSSGNYLVLTRSDVAPASVKMEWSTDAFNQDFSEDLNPLPLAGVGSSYQVMARGQYYRLRYTNGAAPQGFFRLQTVARNATGGGIGSTNFVQQTSPGPGSPATPVSQSGAWNVGQVGPWTVTSNQGTSPWVTGFGGVAQPVTQSGTWTVQQGTPPWTVATHAVTQGTSPWVVGFGGVGQPVTGTFFQATQPVSGTVTANQGTSPWVVVSTGPTFNAENSAFGAGSTPLFTPDAGKRFRIWGYSVMVSGDTTVAVATDLNIRLLDGAAEIGQAAPGDGRRLRHRPFVPAIALNNSGVLYQSPWIDLRGGIVSVAANNVLNIDLSVAVLTGRVEVLAAISQE